MAENNDEGKSGVRHSEARDAELISDPYEQATAEARNTLRQVDEADRIVEYYVENGQPFRLRVSTLLHLHRVALDGISPYAGNFRPSSVLINKSKHKPVGAFMVPAKVEELCDYVNDSWRTASALH